MFKKKLMLSLTVQATVSSQAILERICYPKARQQISLLASTSIQSVPCINQFCYWRLREAILLRSTSAGIKLYHFYNEKAGKRWILETSYEVFWSQETVKVQRISLAKVCILLYLQIFLPQEESSEPETAHGETKSSDPGLFICRFISPLK